MVTQTRLQVERFCRDKGFGVGRDSDDHRGGAITSICEVGDVITEGTRAGERHAVSCGSAADSRLDHDRARGVTRQDACCCICGAVGQIVKGGSHLSGGGAPCRCCVGEACKRDFFALTQVLESHRRELGCEADQLLQHHATIGFNGFVQRDVELEDRRIVVVA